MAGDWGLATLKGGIMPSFTNSRRGITVLALVLLIIAVAVGGYLLMRYLNPSTF